MIYFAVDNSIIVMDIFDSTLTLQYLGLPRCTQIHKLVPTIGARNQLLLVAYCIDRYIYFDPQYGDWATMHLFYHTYVLTTTVEFFFFIDSEGGVLKYSVNNSSP